VLEAGGVMVQYGGAASAADVAALESLAVDGVVVAPLSKADPAVVATAWLHKQECAAVDTGAVEQFIDDHLGATEGH